MSYTAMAAPTMPRVLLVAKAPELARRFREYLRAQPVVLEHAACGRVALARIAARPPEVVLLDLALPGGEWHAVLAYNRTSGSPSRVIVLAGDADFGVAAQAMGAGASAHLSGPVTAQRLQAALRQALTAAQGSSCAGAPDGEAAEMDFEGFVGRSEAMRGVYRSIDCAARSRAAVFVSGETGTGKELCAQAIHRRSARRNRPFIALNCSAMPKELMESEIFGHTKGAYTGAVRARAGAAKRADGGTLFLDEICEMEPTLQAKLLRFLQSGTFMPLGSDHSETVDVRLICATNRDPLHEIAAGRCRQDLYYRIHVVPIHLLPLRERRRDILQIAVHYLSVFSGEEGKSFTSFDPEVETALGDYDWPGNVRQLMNVIRTVTVLHQGPVVTPAMLPPLEPAPTLEGWINGVAFDKSGAGNGGIKPLKEMERELIERAVARCDGNVVEAARLLEISPSTIYRKRTGWNGGARY